MVPHAVAAVWLRLALQRTQFAKIFGIAEVYHGVEPLDFLFIEHSYTTPRRGKHE